MPQTLKRILPTPFEFVTLLLLAVGLVALGNTQSLLDYYNLNSSTQVIHHTAGSAITAGLGHLDSFNFTAQAVTFLIWAGVGLFCLSFLQMIGRIIHGFQVDKELSSSRYVHPATFVKASFWKYVILDFILLVVGIGWLAVATYLFLAYMLPVSLAYTRQFIENFSLAHLGEAALGLAVLYAWMLVFCVLVKLIVHRRLLFIKN